VLKNRILLKILDPHPDADEFHNLTSFSLSTDFYTDPISSFHVAYRQTDRQTDRQTGRFSWLLSLVILESSAMLLFPLFLLVLLSEDAKFK